MKTKKRKLPVLIGGGLACAQKEQAHQQLWLAVAEAAQKGMVTCPEAPTLDAALYGLTLRCAEVERSADDDLRASMALSEAVLPVRGRWRKNGFAYGIKRVGRLTVRVPGKGLIEFADWVSS
jgi:hypothetical protein